MLNFILNIIGIILVIYSIFIIKKDISLKKDEEFKLLELNEMNMDSYKVTNKNIEEFDQGEFDKMIYQKTKNTNIDMKETEEKTENNIINYYGNSIIKENKISEDKNINPLHKKIIELKSIGLDNEEIARKLGKGIREIDIIIKIYKI